jgi:hypothetical protein
MFLEEEPWTLEIVSHQVSQSTLVPASHHPSPSPLPTEEFAAH